MQSYIHYCYPSLKSLALPCMVEYKVGRNRQELEYKKQITLYYVSAITHIVELGGKETHIVGLGGKETHIVGSGGKESFNNGVSRL